MTAKQLFRYLVGGGALTLLLFSVLLYWLWGRVSAASDDLLTVQASEVGLATRNQSLAKLSRDYDRLSPSLALLGQALPAPITPEIVLNSLRSVAAASGVAISSYDFAAPAVPAAKTVPGGGAAPAAPSVGYSIKISGPYSAVQAFLTRTNTMTPLSDVKSINVTKPVKENDGLEVTLQMVSYGGR